MAKDYTPIFHDWIEVTRELNAQEKGRLIDAIVLYDMNGDWQEQIKGNERYVFPGYQVRIDRWNEISGIRAQAGRNKQTETNGSKTEQNEAKENKTPKDKDKVKDKDKENTPKGVKEKLRFSPPTVDEVAAYCRERQNGVDAQRFVDFYAAKGWKIGQNPMKDWKAAVRTWEQREGNITPLKTVAAQQYAQRSYTEGELESRVDDL